MYIEITQVSPEGLDREVWNFWLNFPHGHGSLKVKLDGYYYQTRQTKRHGWRISVDHPHYERLSRGGRHYNQNAVDVPPSVPESVIKEFKEKLIDSLEFKLEET